MKKNSMKKYIILPNRRDTFLERHNEVFTKALLNKTSGEKLTRKAAQRREKQQDFINLIAEANAAEHWRNTMNVDDVSVTDKDMEEAFEVRFEKYLNSVLEEVSKTTVDIVDTDIISKQSTASAMSEVVDTYKSINMKPKEFFTESKFVYDSVIKTVSQSITHNENITDRHKSFLSECLNYVGYLTQSSLLFLKPVDFLFAFKENANLTKLTVILYCIYDLMYTTGSALQLRKVHVRNIREHFIPKEKKQKVKRPRYLAIVYKDALTFTSNIVCEFLLQMIEGGVLRCSSLSKAFLLTTNQTVFYKYCLIAKKVCLKRIVEPRSVRI